MEKKINIQFMADKISVNSVKQKYVFLFVELVQYTEA